MTALPAPIRIAFCITELDRGGAEKAFTRLVLGLDRQEWLPRVFCLGPRGYFAGVLEAGGVEVECFDGKGMISFPSVLIRLTMALRRFRPSLLQTFLFHANVIGRLAGRMACVPRVVSGIRVAERSCRWHGPLDRWTNGLVDHNVCVSQGVADFSIHDTGLPSGKVSVIPNGVDFEQFADAKPADLTEFRIPAGCPVFITVGRLEYQKGIDVLLKSARQLLADYPQAHFLVVGDGSGRAHLEALAQELGISGSVHFVGHRPDVPNLLKSATAFVLPSRWEGMANALLEAMAAGLPVIATSVEGSTELIHSGETGVLVSSENVEELTRAMAHLLKSTDAAAEMAKKSQLYVIKWHANDLLAVAYCSLYQELLRHK